MSIFILFTILVSLALIGLGLLFLCKAKEKRLANKRVESILAIVGALVAFGFFLNLIFHLFPLTVDELIKQDVLCTLVGTILTWLAASLLKKGWRKALLLVSPLFFFAFIAYIGTSSVLGSDIPMTRHEVEYSDTEQLSKVLGNVTLPEMEFNEAWQSPYYRTVILKLSNASDSSKLTSIYEYLKAQNPLQIMENDPVGRMYMQINPEQNRYVNVMFNNSEVKIVYGDVLEVPSEFITQLDARGIKLPDYKPLTYMLQDLGPDWTMTQRVEFVDTLPMVWFEKIEQTALKDSGLEFEKDEEAYNISCHDNHRAGRMRLYKNPNGERQVAEIEWGSY